MTLITDLYSVLLMLHSSDYINKFQKNQDKGNLLVIYGAGTVGRLTLDALKEKNIKANYFCDNDPAKWNTEIENTKVISASDLYRLDKNIDIFICYYIFDAYVPSLENKGFKNLYSKPKPEHALQLQIYMQLLDKAYGIVLYENKNDQKLKAFKVKRSPKEWVALVKRCTKIQEAVEIPENCTGAPWCACRNYKEGEDGREVDTNEGTGESE